MSDDILSKHHLLSQSFKDQVKYLCYKLVKLLFDRDQIISNFPNKIIRMDQSQQLPSASIKKISASTLQFKQLISCLRNRKLGLPPPSNSINQTQYNNAIENGETHNSQSEDTGIKLKARANVLGRDLLKNKQENIPHTKEQANPEQELQIIPEQAIKPLKAISPPIFESHSQFIPLRSSPASFSRSQASPTQFSFHSSGSLQPISVLPVSSVSTPLKQQITLQKHLRPQFKVAQIVRQKIKIDQEINKQKELGFSINIEDIDQSKVVEYCRKERWPNEHYKPGELFQYFTGLVAACGTNLHSPFLKKYHNCLYYGESPSQNHCYSGFLMFFTPVIYFGQFSNSLKDGNGTEIHFLADGNIEIWKGTFLKGAKTGKFKVQKKGEKYIGWLKDGKYDGEGKLQSQEFVYEGYFQNGQKQGYGQEFYPKTGVKFAGVFKNGKFVTKRASKSISQLPKHNRLPYTSLHKHNQAIKVMRTNMSQLESSSTPTSTASNLPAFNRQKLQVYIQHSAKRRQKHQSKEKQLPKLREYDYSLEGTSEGRQETFAKQPILSQKHDRIDSGLYEQPLPMPFLTCFKQKK